MSCLDYSRRPPGRLFSLSPFSSELTTSWADTEKVCWPISLAQVSRTWVHCQIRASSCDSVSSTPEQQGGFHLDYNSLISGAAAFAPEQPFVPRPEYLNRSFTAHSAALSRELSVSTDEGLSEDMLRPTNPTTSRAWTYPKPQAHCIFVHPNFSQTQTMFWYSKSMSWYSWIHADHCCV